MLKVRTRPRRLGPVCGVWVRNVNTLFAVVGGRRPEARPGEGAPCARWVREELGSAVLSNVYVGE